MQNADGTFAVGILSGYCSAMGPNKYSQFNEAMKTTAAAVLVLLFLVNGATAQKKGNHEVSFGLGVTFPSEESPLNIAGERALSSAAIGSGAYRFYVAELLSVGVRAFLTSSKLTDYLVTQEGESSPTKVDFTLTSFNAGVESILLLSSRRTYKPYLVFLLLYSEGSLSNDRLGSLKYTGYLAGGGAGMRIAVSERVALSAEGVGLFGTARWKSNPAKNSTGTEFNPSSLRALLSVSFILK